MSIKKKIKPEKLPAVKSNTVVENIAEIVEKLHLSKEYESAKTSDETAMLKTKIGLVTKNLLFHKKSICSENIEFQLNQNLIEKKLFKEKCRSKILKMKGNFFFDFFLYMEFNFLL